MKKSRWRGFRPLAGIKCNGMQWQLSDNMVIFNLLSSPHGDKLQSCESQERGRKSGLSSPHGDKLQ